MRQRVLPAAGWGVLGLLLSGGLDALGAEPLLSTQQLCGPGSGSIGTSWVSLPSESVILTAEQLCEAIVPTPVSVSQAFPGDTGRYTYDCTTKSCTTTSTVPEPGCTASTCFCVDPGEGVEVAASAPSTLDIYGCDSFATLTVPISTGLGGLSRGTLVSVPYNTFLRTLTDLGLYFGLPSGILHGSVAWMDCETGMIAYCSVGAAICNTALLVPGTAYSLVGPTAGTFKVTNPVACLPPNPPASACPIDGLTVTPSGGSEVLTWNPANAGACPAARYQVARFDLACLVHQCRACASCSIVGMTDAASFTDTPPEGTWAYLVSAVGGTWNSTGSTQCIDRDMMFGAGCP